MKILDIALKDMLRFFRSRFAIGMMFVAPLMITGLLYMAFGGTASGKTDLPVTKVVVVNLDEPPAGAPALGKLVVDMFNDPSVAGWLQASQADSESAALSLVNSQQAGVAVIIPAGFTRSVLDANGSAARSAGPSSPVEIRLVSDPTLTVGPQVVKNMIGSLVDGVSGARIALQTDAERLTSLGQSPDPAQQKAISDAYQQWFTDFQRTLYHSPQAALVAQAPALSGAAPDSAASGGVPTDITRILALALTGQIIFFGFFTGAYAMMSILKEQEEGTLARQFTTPTSRTLILGGKFLAVLFMVTVQAVVMLVIGALLFKVSWGQPLSVALAVVGQVCGATGLGVLLISLVKDSKQAGPVLGGGLSGLGMLGGLFTTAVPGLPKAFDMAGLFTPQGWILKGWKACLAGAGPAEMALPLLVLLAMGVVMFALGAVIFRRRFA